MLLNSSLMRRTSSHVPPQCPTVTRTPPSSGPALLASPNRSCRRREGNLAVLRVKIGESLPPVRRSRPPRPVLNTASSANSCAGRGRRHDRTTAPRPKLVNIANRVRTQQRRHRDQPTHRHPPPRRPGLHRRRFIDPNGHSNREPHTIIAEHAGTRSPRRQRGQTHPRRKTNGERGGYVHPHSAVDGYSRLAYTEALPNEKAATAIGFIAPRASVVRRGRAVIRRRKTKRSQQTATCCAATPLISMGRLRYRRTPTTPQPYRAAATSA